MKAVIFLDELIQTKLNPKGEISETIGKGKIFVKNESLQTTLWAITLGATYGPDVKEFNEQQIQHVQPHHKFEDKYSIETESKLILQERLDTHFTGQSGDDLDLSRDTLIKGKEQKVLYEFTLENKYSFELTDIELIKSFDQCTSDFDAIPPHPGSISKIDDRLIWKIDKINPNEVLTIYVVVDQKPTTSEKIKTGEINVVARGSGLISSLQPTIDSECDNVDLSVDVKETANPGVWNITTEYTNSSEFATLLEYVKVGNVNNYFLDKKVNELFQPNPDGAAWSNAQEFNSPDYPQIEKNFKYQVDFEVKTLIEIQIFKETDLLDVVEIHSKKRFEPEEVNTYTRTSFKFFVDVTNIGTAEIGKLVFEEQIPPFILVKSVKSNCMGKDLALTTSINEDTGLDEEIPENLTEARKLTAEVTTNGFVPNSNVILEVECIAEKPKPNLDYHAESTVSAYAVSPTLAFVISSIMDEKTPELKVAYKMRSFKFSANYKSVAADKYEITIPISNNGEVPLENIYLTQGIMGGSYANHSPLTITAEEKGDKIEFYIKEIPVGETINIIIEVSTNGPLRQTQPSIRIAD